MLKLTIYLKVIFSLIFLFYYLFISPIGWHNRFAHRIDKKHPNIWYFIQVLQREEVYVKQLVQHVKMGKIKKISKKTIQKQECLQNLNGQFNRNEITLNGYLDGLSLLVAKKY